MKPKHLILAWVVFFIVLLAGCDNYQWGTIIGSSPDNDKLGCFGEIQRVTIQLDDGRTVVKCMDAPKGLRVQICPSQGCLDKTLKLDPKNIK